jgi:RND family efflux transporter MFP subunit
MKALPVLILAALLLPGCGRSPEKHEAPAPSLPPARVELKAAERKQHMNTEEVVGTVRPRLQATLEAKVSGRIAEMPAQLGQSVKAGQMLARLDAPEIRARLEQAQARLQQAERDWKRMSGLLEQQAATRSDADAAESAFMGAKAGLAEAQAMLAYVEVTAPFNGVVTKKWTDVGDLASPGKPLVSIEDPSVLQLESDISEALASHVQLNSRLMIRSGGSQEDVGGTVSEIAPSADPMTRTFRVKLDLPKNARLRSGQFARLLVPVGESSSLRVPASAVVNRGQMEIVFVAADQRAQLRLVKTGRTIGSDTEILAGLEPGEFVVVTGAEQLVEGQPLETK